MPRRDFSDVAAWGSPCTLIAKEDFVTEGKDRLPVRHFTFSTPEGADFAYDVGLADTCKICTGTSKPKSYSPFDVSPGQFNLGVKIYPGGHNSGHLDRLNIGDELYCFRNNKGRTRNPGLYHGLVAFGIGITESLPVAEIELKHSDAKKVVLLWANRTMADTFWADRIAALKEEHKDRFEVVYLLSREPASESHAPGTLYGRISPEVVTAAFETRFGVVDDPDLRSQCRWVSVGTKEMMRMFDRMLEGMGYSMPHCALLNQPRRSK